MIQAPINVVPQNNAVDRNNNSHVQFTFKGDFCSGVWGRIYDYDTGELVKEWQRYGGNEPLAYNDKVVTMTNILGTPLTNGRNYTFEMMLIQKTRNGSAVICDMPVFSGNVGEKQSELGSTTSIIVSKDITNIYPWGKSGNIYSPTDYTGSIPFCRMTIQIGDEVREISSYTNDTTNGVGIIAVNSAFTSVTAGMPYKIYSNYLITQPYYFECRTTPTVVFQHDLTSDYIHYHGTYSQAENDFIKYYQLSLVWSNNESFLDRVGGVGNKAEVIETTNKIYSQDIDYYFERPYRHDEDMDDPDTDTYCNDYYKVVCDITTQGGQTITVEDDSFYRIPWVCDGEVYGDTLYSFKLQWDSALGRVIHKLRGYGSVGQGVHGSYELTREDLISGEIIQLPPHHFGYGETAEIIGYDLLASTHGNYRYTLKLYDDRDVIVGQQIGQVIVPNISPYYDGIGHFPCNDIETSECAYYITELDERVPTGTDQRNKTKKKYFDIGDTWVFRGDIQDTTVTNNLDSEMHVGYNRYISSTATNVNYMSGTLTALLGYVNCANHEYVDDISLVRAWRKFITQKKPFLLKSQKGDVWVVNVVNTPTTTYNESHYSLPTTISFDWAESYGLDEVVVFDPSAELRPVGE